MGYAIGIEYTMGMGSNMSMGSTMCMGSIMAMMCNMGLSAHKSQGSIDKSVPDGDEGGKKVNSRPMSSTLIKKT